MKIKRVSVLTTIMLMVNSSIVLGGEVGYKDVPTNHSAYKEIEYLRKEGIVKGYEGGLYRPSEYITRVELAEILYKTKEKEKLELKGELKDIKEGYWGKESIEVLVSRGCYEGIIKEGKFEPNKELTKEEAWLIIGRYLGIEDKEEDKLIRYKDSKSIKEENRCVIEGLLEEGYIKGERGLLRAGEGLTRAEVGVIMYKIREGVEVKEEGVELKYKEKQENLLRLVNEIRDKVGLSELKMDNRIKEIAMLKAEDMEENGYFGHISPEYGSPREMLESNGIKVERVGENIASGYENEEELIKEWLNSKSHRENILNPRYTHIGIGLKEKETGGYTWVQLFVTK